MSTAAWLELHAVLGAARDLGFLGPGPVERHIEHGQGFVAVADAALDHEPGNWCDLGSGGGVPGLVLALSWPGSTGVLVESSQRRAGFLREALARLDLETRILVREDRAEVLGQALERRESFVLTTARGFATPAATAEIASGLVAVGGVLIVSEPPEALPNRWPAHELAKLGFAPVVRTSAQDAHFAVLRKARAAPPSVPRRVGRPTKRPRWSSST